MTATTTPIEIAISGREWRSITPFVVNLGSGPTMALVVARLDLEPGNPLSGILDRWPDAVGNPVRVVMPPGGEWLGNIIFVDRFRPGQPGESLRVYLARG